MKGNVLGDIRAEHDTQMLNSAFYETPDYKSLLMSNDRCVVVGRRGAGKSALAYQLSRYWQSQKNVFVLNIAPQEDQMIGIRGLSKAFGDQFVHIKAGIKIAWKYALYMEIASRLTSHYKLKKAVADTELLRMVKSWGPASANISSKLRNALKKAVAAELSPEENIAELSGKLELHAAEGALTHVLNETRIEIVLLIDRLDEGYTPDTVGVAIADAFVQAVIDLNSTFQQRARCVVFLRDNMYRSIAINDPDFTRNIEGQVLRLHWDEYALFNMVCNRIRVAFSSDKENSTKIWGRIHRKRTERPLSSVNYLGRFSVN